MGQTLSEPITVKNTTADTDNRLAYGSSAMQGWRITMEDAHTTILKLSETENSGPLSSAFFAVFDGHGGPTVAKYAGTHLHHRLTKSDLFKQGKYSEALRETFLGIDVDMMEDPEMSKEVSGCTAVSAVITDDWKVIVANAGDSRAVLSCNGDAIPLSFDHKPTNPEETRRIVDAGGYVEFGRVNGNLALSRAIGDFEFKKNITLPPEQQAVTVNPDIIERELLDTDEFIIIACDGIWDCMSNQAAVHFVSHKISQGVDLAQICEQMMDACLAKSSDFSNFGCDNMTIIIIALLKNKTKQELFESIKIRYDTSDAKQEFNDLFAQTTTSTQDDDINNGQGVN